MKITEAQKRAMAKMKPEWQCAYELRESLNTLNAMARKGIIEHKQDRLGAMFSPTTANHYRLPANAHVDLPDTAAQDSASKSNNPAVSG